MFKTMFSGSDNHVGLLASANLGLSAATHWMTSVTNAFSVLVPLGQVAVSAVTVIYIWRKAASIHKRTNRKKSK